MESESNGSNGRISRKRYMNMRIDENIRLTSGDSETIFNDLSMSRIFGS